VSSRPDVCTSYADRAHVDLTPQGEVVTSLVAQALSNREAAEIYLSPASTNWV